MGCNASARLAAQLILTKEELEKIKKDITISSDRRIELESTLLRVRLSATVLTSENEKLKHELILKSGDEGAGASVFESAREEQERLQEWMQMEMTEGKLLFSSILKMHGTDESGVQENEMKKCMETIEESDYNNEKLKEFSRWKYNLLQHELADMMDERSVWMNFITAYEEEIKSDCEQIDRESGGKARPQLAEVKTNMSRLPSPEQPLQRLKALREVEQFLCRLRMRSTNEVDADTKNLIERQAEEVKVLKQRLAAQRKLEEERKASAEKELSLKEVHIKHLENKVRDLARPAVVEADVRAKDREIEKLKAEIVRAREDKFSVLEQAAAVSHAIEEVSEQVRVKEEELERIRT